jgi:hypothetical protein
MPAYSTLRSFVKAIKTGDSNITQCLERLANDVAKRQQYLSDINATHTAVGALPGWLQIELIQAGLSQAEVDHCSRWPDAEKEKVRKQVADAIPERRSIHFSWELWDGNDADSDVRRDSDQDVRIVFRSPRKGVKLSSLNYGDISVEA